MQNFFLLDIVLVINQLWYIQADIFSLSIFDRRFGPFLMKKLKNK